MLSEMLENSIGKTVTIMAEGQLSGWQGKVLEVKDNWVKLEQKKNIILVNADMISYISLTKES